MARYAVGVEAGEMTQSDPAAEGGVVVIDETAGEAAVVTAAVPANAMASAIVVVLVQLEAALR